MALVRISALKDFRTAGVSTTDLSTAFNLALPTAGQSMYGGLHLTSASLGTTARMLVMTLQQSSSSGFTLTTTAYTFALSTVQAGEWATPVASLSTDRVWWRANWTLSTAVSTGGLWKGLTWVGFK